jgi:hypothetical protein
MAFSDTDRGRKMEELKLLDINFSVTTTKDTTTIQTFMVTPTETWVYDINGKEIFDLI